MHYAHVPLEYRYKLFHDCYATAAMVDGLMIVNVNGKFASQFEHFCGANPKCTAYLRTWGEAGMVKLCQMLLHFVLFCVLLTIECLHIQCQKFCCHL